jgi:hypothetical protein
VSGQLDAHCDELKSLLDDGLTAVSAGELLARRGIVVPEWTLLRYALEALGHGRENRRGVTARLADCEPGPSASLTSGRWACWPTRPPPGDARADNLKMA